MLGTIFDRAYVWLVLVISVAFCAQVACAKACGAELPFPDGRVEHYGCSVGSIDRSVKVNARDLNKPVREFLTTVWATIVGEPKKWEGELQHRTERIRALKDCDKWMAAMERRFRKP